MERGRGGHAKGQGQGRVPPEEEQQHGQQQKEEGGRRGGGRLLPAAEPVRSRPTHCVAWGGRAVCVVCMCEVVWSVVWFAKRERSRWRGGDSRQASRRRVAGHACARRVFEDQDHRSRQVGSVKRPGNDALLVTVGVGVGGGESVFSIFGKQGMSTQTHFIHHRLLHHHLIAAAAQNLRDCAKLLRIRIMPITDPCVSLVRLSMPLTACLAWDE